MKWKLRPETSIVPEILKKMASSPKHLLSQLYSMGSRVPSPMSGETSPPGSAPPNPTKPRQWGKGRWQGLGEVWV